MSELSDFRKRKLSTLFAAFDGDRDELLTNADPGIIIARLAKIAGLEPDSQTHKNFEMGFMAYWKDFIMSSDLNEDGKVTIEEWYSYHATMLQDERRFAQTVAMSAGVMFALMDGDNDGFMSLEDYGRWPGAWQVDPSVITEELLARLDIGGNGKLSSEQVIALTREFFYSEDPEAPGNWCMGPLA